MDNKRKVQNATEKMSEFKKIESKRRHDQTIEVTSYYIINEMKSLFHRYHNCFQGIEYRCL